MKNNFQIILVAVFVVAAVIGLLIFSGAIPLGGDSTKDNLGTVVLWGTFKAESVNSLLDEFNDVNPNIVVTYVQKSPENFDQDLLEALASGVGPDLFFLPDELAFHYRNKIRAIPYENYSVSSFKKTFAQAGEVFMNSAGIMAFPVTIDPLVMYYNRDTLDAKGIVYPPATWNEFTAMVPLLTERDQTNKIIKSATALGHFSNVLHAKDILSTLFMQLGSKIVVEKEGRFNSDLSATGLNNVLSFYTDFADPQKDVYSWNKSFPVSRDYFSTNNLAFYFGYASELVSLINKNPNQNFQVAQMPQLKDASFKVTGAKVTGIAVSTASKNPNTAFIVADALSSGTFAFKLAQNLGVVPARRDLLAVKPTDAYYPTFYASGLYARSWLDPSPVDTDDIFRRMIDGVLSGSLRTSEAMQDASSKLSLLLNK